MILAYVTFLERLAIILLQSADKNVLRFIYHVTSCVLLTTKYNNIGIVYSLKSN